MHNSRKLLTLLLGLMLVLVTVAACADDNGDEELVESDAPTFGPVTPDAEANDDDSTEDDTAIEPDELDSDFEITISGNASLTMTPNDTEYSYDLEEASGLTEGAAGQGADQLADDGLYIMRFVQDFADLEVRFSDTIQNGTYPFVAPMEGGQPQYIIGAFVNAEERTYNTTTEGSLTFTQFGDNRVSGEIDVTLEGDIGSVTVEGSFENLPLETIPAEALDANIGSEPLEDDPREEVPEEPS